MALDRYGHSDAGARAYHEAKFPKKWRDGLQPMHRWFATASGYRIARTMRAVRDFALIGWVEAHGKDPANWPCSHPTIALEWNPETCLDHDRGLWVTYDGMCLACDWLSRSSTDIDVIDRSGREHCTEHGCGAAETGGHAVFSVWHRGTWGEHPTLCVNLSDDRLDWSERQAAGLAVREAGVQAWDRRMRSPRKDLP